MLASARSKYCLIRFASIALLASGLLLAVNDSGSAQSLVEVAKKEKKRREANRKRGVEAESYTVVGLPGTPGPKPEPAVASSETQVDRSKEKESTVEPPVEPEEREGEVPIVEVESVVKRSIGSPAVPVGAGGPATSLQPSDKETSQDCLTAQLQKTQLREQFSRLQSQLSACDASKQQPGAEDRVGQEIERLQEERCRALRATQEAFERTLAELERQCSAELGSRQ